MIEWAPTIEIGREASQRAKRVQTCIVRKRSVVRPKLLARGANSRTMHLGKPGGSDHGHEHQFTRNASAGVTATTRSREKPRIRS
jgi:hypothetical protein